MNKSEILTLFSCCQLLHRRMLLVKYAYIFYQGAAWGLNLAYWLNETPFKILVCETASIISVVVSFFMHGLMSSPLNNPIFFSLSCEFSLQNIALLWDCYFWGSLGSLAKISGCRICRRIGKLNYRSLMVISRKSQVSHKICHPRSQRSIFFES